MNRRKIGTSTWHCVPNNRIFWQLSSYNASQTQKHNSKRILAVDYNLMQKLSNFPETFHKSKAGLDNCLHHYRKVAFISRILFLV